MYNIVKTTKYWMGLSGILMVATIVIWIMWGLNLGIEFTGGTSMQLHFPTASIRPTATLATAILGEIGINGGRVQEAGESDLVLNLPPITNEERQKILDKWKDLKIIEANFSSVGPTLGAEMKKKSVIAIIIVLLAIIGYVSYAFRKISHGPVPSWAYGLAAIIALVHDILLVIGVFIILGKFYNVQIDTLFITALLTILGFSVHDTIVVFDRIRERMKYRATKTFSEIINESINSTLGRSLNTSLTTLIVLLALYLFGGTAIHYFVLALIFGIITGTYSSIFVASPLLLFAQKLLKR